MHWSMRDGGIEHVRLLVRWRRTPTEADGDENNQDAEKTFHAHNVTPNENKISHRWRERALIAIETLKSCEN
jgi:hypothetical protein